ncbi:hypothetical protein ACSQ67_001105 [Phaseolus vulgaris]
MYNFVLLERQQINHVYGGADHSNLGSATDSATSAATANDSDVGACCDNAASGDVGCLLQTLPRSDSSL